MTDCFKCMKLLPYECTCNVSEETKFRQCCDVAKRETDLMLAILDGHQPIIRVGKVDYPTETEILYGGAWIKVNVHVLSEDWRKTKSYILLDKTGAPLYRQTLSSLGVTGIRKGDDLKFTWDLSINRRPQFDESS